MYQDLLENLNYIEGLYIYGSGEMDQLSPLKEASKDEKDIYQTSVPRKVPLHFIRDTETIKSIQCGELYTLILSTEGNVYTFGCADDGTLGHEETFSAKRVPLKFPATGVSGGDCHGIAYNRENLAFWGRFRNKNGGIGETCHEPTYFNNNHIHNEFYKKAISGANHVLILTEKKNVYAFGSNDSGQIGVSPGKRFHHFQMNKLYEKNVEDIFTGDEYSFLTKYENKTKILKSWGANGNGQLGIGSYQTNIKENVTIYVPTKVLFPGISTVSVKKVCGGSGTSICITEDNRVFVWGLNDFSQLGLKTEEKVIPRPKEIEFFNPYTNPDNTVDDIYSRNQYFYAKNSKLNKVYSWGMGDCYVLGNRKEKSEPTPYLVNHLFFKNLYVKDLALGSAHVVALLIENKDMKIDVSENKNKNQNQQKLVEHNNNSKNKNKNTPRKGVKDESFEENNKKDENFGVLIRVKEEFITLKESDQPKASAKKLLTEKKIIKKDNNNNNNNNNSSVDSNTNDEDLLNVIIENKAKKDNKKSLSEKNSISMKKTKESPKKEKEEKVKQKKITKKEEKTKSPIKNNSKRKNDSKKDNDDYEKIEIDKDEDEDEEEKNKKNLKNTKNQSKNKNKKQIIEEKEEKQEKTQLKNNNSNNRRKSSTKKEENVEPEKEIYLTRSSRRKTPSSSSITKEKEKEKDEQKNNNKIPEDKKSKKSTRSSKSTKNQKDEDDNYIPIINDKDIKKNKKTNSSSSKNKNAKKENENDDIKKDEDISENNINSSRRKYSYPKSNKSPSKKEEVKNRSKNNGEKSKKKSKSKSKDRYPKRK